MRRGRGRRVWAVRAAVLAGLTAAAAGIAFVLADTGGSATTATTAADPTAPVARFVAAWHGGDYRTMYAQISPAARARISYARFVALYRRAAVVATMRGLHAVGRPRPRPD